MAPIAYALFDLSHIRLAFARIGYSLPDKWLRKTKFLKGVNIFVVGQNVFSVFTSSDAPPRDYDPQQFGRGGLIPGNTARPVRTVSSGLELTF